VGQSYIPVDFLVLEIGGDVRVPIILGRPFLSTVKAIIYADSARIYFPIKDKKEKFSNKNRIMQSPRHPQMSYLPEETVVIKKKNNWRRRKNKARQSPEESVNMMNTL
jgi:hypothetical protein